MTDYFEIIQKSQSAILVILLILFIFSNKFLPSRLIFKDEGWHLPKKMFYKFYNFLILLSPFYLTSHVKSEKTSEIFTYHCYDLHVIPCYITIYPEITIFPVKFKLLPTPVLFSKYVKSVTKINIWLWFSCLFFLRLGMAKVRMIFAEFHNVVGATIC